MNIHLNPDQQALMERAAHLGMSPEEVLDQAFAIIQQQHQDLDWMVTARDAIASHIATGVAQAERGELIEPEEAVRILHERRKQRQIA